MDKIITVLLVFVGIFAIASALMYGWISKGIGWRNLWAIAKVAKKVKKGWILVKIRELTGHPRLIAHQLKSGESIEIELDDKTEKYLYKDYCVYPHEFAKIPTIEFLRGNSEPIDQRTGLQTITSSRVLNNTVAKIVKADAILNSPLEDFLKKYGMFIAILLAAVVGVLIYVNMNNIDQLNKCMDAVTSQAIINITALGK
jgi:hypothetical protein